MTALRHLPGQVVVYGSSAIAPRFDESYLSAFAELAFTSTYELPHGQRSLELFVVNVGEELRFLDFARAQPGVISAGLNYLATGLDTARAEPGAEYPELRHTPGLLRRLPETYCLVRRLASPQRTIDFRVKRGSLSKAPASKAEPAAVKSPDELVADLDRFRGAELVVAVDVNVEHCEAVMTAMAEGFRAGGGAEAVLLGLTARIDEVSITDLLAVADRLLFLVSLVGPRHKGAFRTLAINLSLDFSNMLRGYDLLDAAALESPGMVISLPEFEAVLRDVVVGIAKVGPEPAIFAAAGNRLASGGGIRVRLGYPAILPEVIAVTVVRSAADAEGVAEPSPAVDLPAVSASKPCFAVDVEHAPMARSDGSSFGCAWLAGHYAGASGPRGSATGPTGEKVRDFGVLGKLGWLSERAERHALPWQPPRLPSPVAVLPTRRASIAEAPELLDLLEQLSKKFDADFAIYGSTATIGEWLRLHGRRFADIDPIVRKDMGDVDVLHAGLPQRQREEVQLLVRTWFRERFGRNWVADRKRPVDLHPLRNSGLLASRFRVVIPVTELLVSRGGLIDTWGGRPDLAQGAIRMLPMTEPEFWHRNKLFRTGADSLALGIARWIGSIALLRLVALGTGGTPPDAAPESLAAVDGILADAEAGRLASPLFGYGLDDPRERLPRRLDRAEALLAACARQAALDPATDRLLRRLRKLWQTETERCQAAPGRLTSVHAR